MGLFSPSRKKVLSELTNTIHSSVIEITLKLGEEKARDIFDNSPCMVFQFCVGAVRNRWEELYNKTMVTPENYDGLYELVEQIFNRGSMSNCYDARNEFELMGWNYQQTNSSIYIDELIEKIIKDGSGGKWINNNYSSYEDESDTVSSQTSTQVEQSENIDPKLNKMIKYIFIVIVILALIGGVVKFESDEQNLSFVVNKDEALSSVKNGAIKVYDFSRDFFK